MGLRSAILLGLVLAAVPGEPLGAAPMGATSKAVLHVTVSVRPRTGVSTVSSGRSGQALCVWSTWKDKKFTVSLSGSSKNNAPIEIVALASPQDCATRRAPLSLRESALYTKGSRLLLIAPE